MAQVCSKSSLVLWSRLGLGAPTRVGKRVAMASKLWHPVFVKETVTVCGGHMKKPYPLDCETVEIDGKRVRMFPIGKQEIWLVGMVTGKRDAAVRRVLKRCNIFIMLKDRLRANIESTASSKEELAGDSKMAAMRFDDDEENHQ